VGAPRSRHPSDQFLTVIVSELTAFFPVTPSRPASMPLYSFMPIGLGYI
jgi:hypothetical protein